jgi:hypothetical protein
LTTVSQKAISADNVPSLVITKTTAKELNVPKIL